MVHIHGAESTRPKKRIEYLPGQMILRIRQDVLPQALRRHGLKLDASEARLLPAAASEPVDYLFRNAGLKAVHPLFSRRRQEVERASVKHSARHHLALLSSVSDSESEQLSGFAVLSLDPKKLKPGLIKHVSAAKSVEIAEPMPARWLASSSRRATDPKVNLQWGLRAIDWFNATLPDASSVRVAVIDSGMDESHPDLRGVVSTYDPGDFSKKDIIGHGTHVTGIIAAVVNNNVGIAGIANCKVDVWKVFPDQPYGGEFYVDGESYLRALNAVIRAGVKVVNLSLGGTASSQTEALLFRRLDRAGILTVAAMGNEYEEGNPTEYPAAYDGVLAVGALAENYKRSVFSNTGRHIGLVAPGSNILSTVPTRSSPYRDEVNYASWSGTSMATPHVSASAALVAAKYQNKTGREIKRHLFKTTTRLPAMGKRKKTSVYGTGLLNLRQALS